MDDNTTFIYDYLYYSDVSDIFNSRNWSWQQQKIIIIIIIII